MKHKKIILISVIFLIITSLIVYTRFKDESLSFKVDTILLKSVVKEKESISNYIKVNNNGDESDFSVNIKGLNNLVELNKDKFELRKDRSEQVEVKFNGEKAGIYSGALIVDNGENVKEVPVILEVQSNDILFATNLDVSPEYKEIKPGDKFSVGIRVFNLKDKEKNNIIINYLIKNLNSEDIISETESITVESEALITKTIILPDDIALGNYVFGVMIKADKSISTSSYLFNVNEKSKNKINVNYFMVLVLILVLGIIVLVFYMIHERDKLFLELKTQHEEEVKYYLEKVKSERKKELSKAKKREKRKIIRKYSRIKKKVEKKIREKHRMQRKELKKLKKDNKKNEMKKKIGEWKKKGYDISNLFKKEENIKNKLREWERQGFNVGILRK